MIAARCCTLSCLPEEGSSLYLHPLLPLQGLLLLLDATFCRHGAAAAAAGVSQSDGQS